MTNSKSETYAYLERLQKAYLEKKGVSDVSSYKDYIEDFVKQNGEEYKEEMIEGSERAYSELQSQNVLNTKYQDPYCYCILKSIVNSLDQVKDEVLLQLKWSNQRKSDFPCWGTVDSGCFAAEIDSSTGHKLIIVSNGLFVFANLICKIISLSFPMLERQSGYEYSADAENIKMHLLNNPAIQQRFNDLMMACLITDTPSFAKQYFADRRYLPLLDIIRYSFETFVVAHEYSHALLGHLDTRHIASTGRMIGLEDTEVQQIFHNWADEEEADLLGAALAMMVMNKKGCDASLSAVGMIVCTISFELFDKISRLKDVKSHITKTHPPGIVRRKIITDQFSDVIESSLVGSVTLIFDTLWDNFLKYYALMKDFVETAFQRDILDVPFSFFQHILYSKVFNEQINLSNPDVDAFLSRKKPKG